MTIQAADPGGGARLRPATPWEWGRLAMLGALIVLTVGAWALTVHQAQTMDMPMGVVARGAAAGSDGTSGMANMDGMSGMAASGMTGGGWTWNAFATFLVAWAVMMMAIMFPAAAPMLLLFHKVSAQRRAGGSAFVPTWVFAAGYLLVWTAIGVLTWVLIQLASNVAGRLGGTTRDTWAPRALGAVLVVAGLYQLTPLKRVCLDHCRTPLGFVMGHWRDGCPGALRMGIVHGAYCLGCCWALFAVLVAAGVMSLAWMALLTLVVFAEKVLPLGRRAPAVAGIAFVALGVLVAADAMGLPWPA
jgi:predicted metal-binding membrane protein